MADAPAAAPKPCCVCRAPGGKHCTKCKARHYCSKECQLVDWNGGGHKLECKKLAAAAVSTAAGAEAIKRAPADRTAATAVVKAAALKAPSWRGTCAVCLYALPVECEQQKFYECCCSRLCTKCANKCLQHDKRCPLCRTPPSKSHAEQILRLKKHVGAGNIEAMVQLGNSYRAGRMGLGQDFKRVFQLYDKAAQQGNALAQVRLALAFESGQGIKVDDLKAFSLYLKAAEQGYPLAMYNVGTLYRKGKGTAQSFDRAVEWYTLAAQQGDADALYMLGVCHNNGQGAAQDDGEALKCFKSAAMRGHAGAKAAAEVVEARL
ncbi:hypothetical protein M885DRAFT_538730 [Pelagophyceae sp. CCMP2097]|nr:hypothetical protein M885DRAFT_538730 [Pelagophyceae sp. CCMP2097]